MTDRGELEEFDEQLAALEQSMGGAQSMTATFAGELERMRSSLTQTNREVKTLSTGISRGLKHAFDGLVFDGMKLSDALNTIGRSMVNTAYGAAVRPVTKQLGGVIATGVAGLFTGAAPFAEGGSFTQGRVMPFANGGLIGGPTYFPMRRGVGLMGEAGPEAIMPLSRGADGRLGVRGEAAGRPVNIVMNVSTPDVQGFRRSQSQIAAQMTRAMARGERNR